MFSARVFVALLFASICHSAPISPQGNFTLNGSSFNCSENVICWGTAHRYVGDADGKFAGRLSLISEVPASARQSAGVAYYKEPVRMLDPSTGLMASFNTSFMIDTIMESWDPITSARLAGDGFTFVMMSSSDSSTLGTPAKCLGIFDYTLVTKYPALVVEFDQYQNTESPINDISGNHVSFDFSNISFVAAANASDVNIDLWAQETLYAWIEYSSTTQQLELRISRNQSRPSSSLLTHTVNLFDIVEEYMWVGFSSGNGDHYSLYYVGNWTFESYGVPPASQKAKTKVSSIVAIAVAVPVLLALAGLVAFFLLRKKKRVTIPKPRSRSFQEFPMLHIAGMPESFSYKQLSVATGSFREESKLGQGGFGSVYRGVLPASGIPVAVKRVSGESRQGEREFVAEVSIISQLRHRNLIQLLGWCQDKGKFLLVYELMHNGSLDKALFRPDEKHPALSWSQRFNILRGTAAALDYLHLGWTQQVIHRDVKSSNIMLDDEWNAKLGDFGLARLVDHQRQAATTSVAGTYGYLAPEAAISGKFTDKTDVFAFGAVALEIACGRAAFRASFPADEMVLVDWVWQRLGEGDLLSVVDKRLSQYDTYWMEVVLLMGLLCSHPNPKSRPSIRQVLQVFAGEAPVPAVPASKPASEFRADFNFVTIDELHGSIDEPHGSNPRTPSSSSTRRTTLFSESSLGTNSLPGSALDGRE